jgi:hypothetical protein
MSKISRNLRRVEINERFCENDSCIVTSLEATEVTKSFQPSAIRYLLGLKIQNSFIATEENPEQLEHATEKLRQSIIYEVFGEFRPIIHKLWEAIYQRDFKKASDLLEELEKQMFT